MIQDVVSKTEKLAEENLQHNKLSEYQLDAIYGTSKSSARGGCKGRTYFPNLLFQI